MNRAIILALTLCMVGCAPAIPQPPKPNPLHKIKKPKQSVEVLDFWAPWCGPCLANRPSIHALQREGYKIDEINIDQHPAKKIRWQITSVPTYIVLVKGKEVLRTHSASELRDYLHAKHPLKKRTPNPDLERDINWQLRQTPQPLY